MTRRSLRWLPAIVVVFACAKEHEHLVHVIAEQAPGLKRAARVQYRGVDVGLVREVYFTPGGVRIDLLIERADVPIRVKDTVRITSVGAFSERVVDIQPGDQSAALLAPGATLPKVQPESTVSLPVGLWRSIVKSLGIAGDSAVKVDSTIRKAP